MTECELNVRIPNNKDLIFDREFRSTVCQSAGEILVIKTVYVIMCFVIVPAIAPVIYRASGPREKQTDSVNK